VPEPVSFERAGERFEVVSRGDHVPGRLWRAEGAGARPLVLVVPALGAGKDASEVVALCRTLAADGWVAAAIDLPLQGERASTKLSARLAACAERDARAGLDRLLWEEFLRQSALDLAAARDALARRDEIEAERIACVAYAAGAAAAEAWAASDPRVPPCLRAERSADPAQLSAQLRRALAGAASSSR
jgi:dienelactone hydrolase